eukprot:GSA25T00010132001.1
MLERLMALSKDDDAEPEDLLGSSGTSSSMALNVIKAGTKNQKPSVKT